MKLIMAERLDPPTGWEAHYYDKGKRAVELRYHDDGQLRTRWGPIVEQREEGDLIHLVEQASNGRTETISISRTELERLEQAADWRTLPDVSPPIYQRMLLDGWATIAYPPPPHWMAYSDDLLTIYQAVHWHTDGRAIATNRHFASGEGNETAFDKASTWSQHIEQGRLQPMASLRFVSVPLAVGVTVRILSGGLNNRPRRLGDQPRRLEGKEAVIVEEWKPGRGWYVTCEGERLQWSLEGNEVSASYYELAESDTTGQPGLAQRYHQADLSDLIGKLHDLEMARGHGTLLFPTVADLKAWHPTYRIVAVPGGATGATP